MIYISKLNCVIQTKKALIWNGQVHGLDWKWKKREKKNSKGKEMKASTVFIMFLFFTGYGEMVLLE